MLNDLVRSQTFKTDWKVVREMSATGVSVSFSPHGRGFSNLIIPRIRLRVAGTWIPLFQVFVVAGLLLGLLLAMIAGAWTGLNPLILVSSLSIAIIGVVSFLILHHALTGHGNLAYYQFAGVATASMAGFLLLMSYPVMPYLDAAVLGLGLAQATGRIGCFFAGCCHGRPARHGIRYGADYRASGLPGYLQGIALIPVQLIEAFWSVCIVMLVGLALIHSPAPGTATITYFTGYGVGRYVSEFLRGDPNRRSRWGVTEAQWISAAVLLGTTVLGLFEIFLLLRWQVVIALIVASLVIGQILLARYCSIIAASISDPRFVDDVAKTLYRNDPDEDLTAPTQTSSGIWISTETIETQTTRTEIYALSCEGGHLRGRTLAATTRLILALRPPQTTHQIVEGQRGTTFLVLESKTKNLSDQAGDKS